MGYLIFILVTIVLAGAFLALTTYEKKTNTRLLGAYRDALDTHVERALFVLDHVDWSAYVKEELHTLFAHIGHFTAHISLRFIRFIERLLTRAVRHLRNRVASDTTPGPTQRPFVEALSGFKRELENSRPAFPEVQ